MLNETLQKVQEFVRNTVMPLHNEIKELQDSLKEEIARFCYTENVAKKDFNEAFRRARKNVSNDVEPLEEAMRGLTIQGGEPAENRTEVMG